MEDSIDDVCVSYRYDYVRSLLLSSLLYIQYDVSLGQHTIAYCTVRKLDDERKAPLLRSVSANGKTTSGRYYCHSYSMMYHWDNTL
jgi:hypothetical protein